MWRLVDSYEGRNMDSIVEMSGALILLQIVLKLENEFLVWTESSKGDILLKIWTWNYIGWPVFWFEITWGYNWWFKYWYWKKWVLMDLNLKWKKSIKLSELNLKVEC